MFLCFLYQRWQWDNSFSPHFLCAEHRQFLQPFSVWRTMTALTIIVCVENTGNSYNHFLCGEQWQLLPSLFVYGTQAKSLNVLCVEHSISILSMKMGLLWKCAQVLFGNSEYLYYYLMPAAHMWLILTIIICAWKHKYTHHFLCEKHNCDNMFCVRKHEQFVTMFGWRTKKYITIMFRVKNTQLWPSLFIYRKQTFLNISLCAQNAKNVY